MEIYNYTKQIHTKNNNNSLIDESNQLPRKCFKKVELRVKKKPSGKKIKNKKAEKNTGERAY
jgi:hypothetical protein